MTAKHNERAMEELSNSVEKLAQQVATTSKILGDTLVKIKWETYINELCRQSKEDSPTKDSLPMECVIAFAKGQYTMFHCLTKRQYHLMCYGKPRVQIKWYHKMVRNIEKERKQQKGANND